MAEDYGVTLKIAADTSDLEKVPATVEQTRKEIERPVEQTVEANIEQPAPVKVPVEQPAPVKIEAKADKVRVEVDDEEAKKRIEALTKKEGIKRIRVVTEGGELATRQGGKEIFELEVDAEKAKQTIAALKADARLKVTADTSQALGSFSILRAATAALHGNVAGLGMEISKLGPKFAAVKTLGVSGIGAILLSLYSVVKLATYLRDLFATLFNVGTVGRDISSIGANLVDIGNKANAFADAMNDARKAADLVNQSLEKEISALGRVAKAQSEINRQRELAAASSDDERADINSRYDRQAIDIGANTAQQSADLKRKALTDEIDRIQKELAQSQETEQAYRQQAANARARAEENILLTDDRKQEGKWGAAKAGIEAWGQSIRKFITHQATSDDKAQAALTVATKAENAADDEVERRAELEEALEKARHDLVIADREDEARKAEENAQREKQRQEEATRKAKIEEKQAQDQQDFTRQQDRAASDAAFEDRMRAAQRRASAPDATEADRNAAENEQIELLRERERQAQAERDAAQQRLDDELKKPANERDEKTLSRAREDIRAADATATGARRDREDLEASAETRRVTVAQDYFGNLAQQIEDSRPKNRLTAMGLGSGDGSGGSTQREQLQVIRQIASEMRAVLDAIRENKPERMTALYTE